MTGHVLEAEPRRNSITGDAFCWALLDTEGGTFDVVIDPSLLSGPVMPGSVLSGWFWLSGRLRVGNQPRRSWLRTLTGRG